MENYNLVYLEQAKDDLKEIAAYVAYELKNPSAALRLAVKITDAAETVRTFPYANGVYSPIRPLKHEYRRVTVENYMLFYYVDEALKTVTVSRIIYGKRNLKKQIK